MRPPESAKNQIDKWNRRLLAIYWAFFAVLALVCTLLYFMYGSDPESAPGGDHDLRFLIPLGGSFAFLLAAHILYLKVVRRRPALFQGCYIMTVFIVLCSVLVGLNYFNNVLYFVYCGPILLSILYIDNRVLLYACIASIAAYFITHFAFIAPFGDPALLNRTLYDDLTAVGLLLSTFLIAALILRRIREAMTVAEKLSVEKARLSRELSRDPFTKLYNHAAFYDQLDINIKDARAFSLIIMDIDNFKRINDGFGHDVGDIVLLRLVGIIKRLLSPGDRAFRYGGEEFAILVKGNQHKAQLLAERIRAALEREPFAELDGGAVTLSLGVCEYDPTFGGRREFFSAADKALYRAKHEGKNRVALAEQN